MSRRTRTAALARRATGRAALAAALALSLAGCGVRKANTAITPMTKMGTDRYVRKAIRSSNEGVILLPSEKAERVYELPRLNEIAHALRDPAALCFLSRAIETMEPAADERGYSGVPEGQVKIRARIAPSGEVVATEILESGFTDERMPACVQRAIEKQQFPPNKGGVNHFVDIVYWVSLGMQSDVHTEAWRDQLKRESIAAGIRAKPCLQGRVPTGAHTIGGLNLVNREGQTMINRIDAQSLPEEVRSCVARAFRDVMMPRQPDAFVRPVATQVAVQIHRDGSIEVDGEEWLRLIELEERARLDERRAALRGEGDQADGPVDEGPTEDGAPEDGAPEDGAPEDDGPAPDTPDDGGDQAGPIDQPAPQTRPTPRSAAVIRAPAASSSS
ncbi:MAG: hypothetical protein U0168_12870 [Nannocystaceae bacterium]